MSRIPFLDFVGFSDIMMLGSKCILPLTSIIIKLKESLAKNDGEEAFRAAHTLKGVCLNLGFDELFEVSAELTEKLRERKTAGSEELFQKVSQKYQKTVMAIQGLE